MAKYVAILGPAGLYAVTALMVHHPPEMFTSPFMRLSHLLHIRSVIEHSARVGHSSRGTETGESSRAPITGATASRAGTPAPARAISSRFFFF